MNTNKVLKELGFGDREDFGEIAKKIAGLNFKNVFELKQFLNVAFPTSELLKMRTSSSEIPQQLFPGTPGYFDQATLNQAYDILRLPVVDQFALMPDGHMGYGFPIGSVVRSESALFPMAVGVDISCMVKYTSVFGVDIYDFRKDVEKWKDAVSSTGRFGFTPKPLADDHEVMYDPRWDMLPKEIRKEVKDKARSQLGTSGGGNHFIDIVHETNLMGADYIGILTHSGSRKAGYILGSYYHKLAIAHTNSVAKGIHKDLSWLDAYSDIGKEYLAVVGLMHRYAKTNHDLIHSHILGKMGVHSAYTVETNHNSIWADDMGGFIHRKGAVSAELGENVLIPGTSGSPSYMMKGLGNPASMQSASHGAGRPFSRTQAKKLFDKEQFEAHMERVNVINLGISPDETVFAYKDIEGVLDLQEDCVKRSRKLQPLIVMMGGKADDGD
jgi:tRNA-splicing ligase RtcB